MKFQKLQLANCARLDILLVQIFSFWADGLYYPLWYDAEFIAESMAESLQNHHISVFWLHGRYEGVLHQTCLPFFQIQADNGSLTYVTWLFYFVRCVINGKQNCNTSRYPNRQTGMFIYLFTFLVLHDGCITSLKLSNMSTDSTNCSIPPSVKFLPTNQLCTTVKQNWRGMMLPIKLSETD